MSFLDSIGNGIQSFMQFGGAGAYQGQLQQLANQYGGRQAPQTVLGQAQGSQYNQNQAGLISQLTAMAQGQGPSAAALQMRQAMEAAAASQSAAAAGAGGRGVNQGAALRNASNNTAALQGQAAGQTAMARVQEQLGAIGQLGGVIQGAIGQQNQLSEFNTGQYNSGQLANQQSQLSTNQMNQQGQLGALQMAMGAAGPGLGNQLLGGLASMTPSVLQYLSKTKGGGGGGGGALAGNGGWTGGVGGYNGGGQTNANWG